MKPITADSMDGRVLLALRAGPTTTSELAERFGYKTPLGHLVRTGLIVNTDDTYRLTDAGRAACPFRNPEAAKVSPPEVFTMPKGETKLTRQKVLDAIVAAGASGLDRKELARMFGHLVGINAIDNHINKLAFEEPPVVFKPRPGLLVDIKFKKAEAAPEIAPETASTATDDWIPEPLATDPAPAAYAVEDLDVEQITARPVVFDTELEDPDAVEFCIYSSGGMDMLTDAGTISLNGAVLGKLRAFLGLFAEAA